MSADTVGAVRDLAPPRPPAPAPRRPPRHDRGQWWLGWILVAPMIALFAVYFAWPLVLAFQISLYDYTGLGAVTDFVGLENYRAAVSDPQLWLGLARNTGFAVVNLVAALVVGSVLAYQLFVKVRGWRVLQVAIFVPHILPVAVVALLWRFIYQPAVGVVDQVRGLVRPGAEPVVWLGTEHLALPAVSLVWAWTVIPLAMLLIFVSMLRIPQELLESARMDGAHEGAILRHVVVPLVQPTLWLVGALVVLGSFRSFDLVYIMTQGGPRYATSTASLYMYKQAFEFNNYGYASALGFVIAIILAIVLPIAGRRMSRSTVEL